MSLAVCLVLGIGIAAPLRAQSSATLEGRVFDPSDAVVAGATVTLSSVATGLDHAATTDDQGRYHLAAISAAVYRVSVAASGFKSIVVEALTVDVGRTLVRDFHLDIGETSETVFVSPERPLLDRATMTVGSVVTSVSVQGIPLNGRSFTDLGLLVPGSVTPSQTGFSTTPSRGVGAFSINTAGNREEAVGFLVNGVTTNNLTFGSLSFQPPLSSVQELKVDNSVFGAEYGHVSGAIINIVTRSGANTFTGEAYGVLSPRPDRPSRRTHPRARAPLRVARDAYGAEQPVRGL
jgi:hypothetical protein